MEEKKRTSSMNALNYGIITGVAMIVYSLLLFIAGLYMNRVIGYLGFILLIAGMVWGTLDYRKKYLNGFMTYGQAFSSTFMIGLFAAIIGAIYMFVFAQYIHPGLQAEIMDQAREKLSQRSEMSDEQMEQALSYTQKFTSPVMMTIFSLVMYVFWSAVIALILSIFLKKADTSQGTVIQ